jgi:hypothetical protein
MKFQMASMDNVGKIVGKFSRIVLEGRLDGICSGSHGTTHYNLSKYLV